MRMAERTAAHLITYNSPVMDSANAQSPIPEDSPASAPGGTPFEQFLPGFRVPGVGCGFLRGNPGLWKYVWMPTAVNLFVGALMAFGLLAVLITAAALLWSWGAAGWLWGLAALLIWLGLLVVSLVVTSALWYALCGIFGGYFLSILAEKTELASGTPRESLREVPWIHQVVDTILNLGLLLLTNIGCLALNLFPFVGSGLAMIASCYFTGMILGTDLLELPMALRGIRRPDVRAFAARKRPYTLGIGTAVMLLNFIPIVGALLLTTAVVGTVLLHKQIEEKTAESPNAGSEPVT